MFGEFHGNVRTGCGHPGIGSGLPWRCYQLLDTLRLGNWFTAATSFYNPAVTFGNIKFGASCGLLLPLIEFD
jgi:hypothetical protein